jgi:hypothetical protein
MLERGHHAGSVGWKNSLMIRFLYQSDLQYGRMKKCPDYIRLLVSAGHLDQYYAIPFHRNLLAFGPLNNIHHFAWVNAKRQGRKKGRMLTTSIQLLGHRRYSKEICSCGDSLLIPQYRSGIMVRDFVIYRMHGYQGDSLDF